MTDVVEGWQRFEIGELGTVITGRTPSTEVQAHFGQKYPFITPSDMDGRKSIVQAERGLSQLGAEAVSSAKVPAGSIMVSCIGWQMGKVAKTSVVSFTNQQINTIVPNGTVDPDFLYYALSTKRRELQNLASVGTRTPILNKSSFEEVEVLVPPPNDQRQIAGILSAYDDLIENNTRRIEILEEMAQAIYREWFVHFRFPGHEDVEMVESELGPVPAGWEVVRLKDVAEINPSNISKNDAPETINYITIGNVSEGRINDVEKMPYADAPSRAKRLVSHGDIIWSKVRPNLKAYALILDPVPNLVASTGFAVVSAERAPYTYLYHALTTEGFVSYLTNLASGAAYPAVKIKDFKDAQVLLPPRSIVEQFDGVVSDLFDLKETLLQKNTVLRETRDLLLPRLVSGEIDVADLHEPAPAHAAM